MNDDHIEIHWAAPKLDAPAFEPLTDEEAAAIRGGAWGPGACAALGYACNTSKGGFRFGVCLGIGLFHQTAD